MFKHILVPTDLSMKSNRALEIAIDMATAANGRITLIHVIEKIEDSDGDEFQSFYDKLASNARLKMEKMTRPHKSSEARIETEIIIGSRVKEIIEFSITHDVDLIILSSHKLTNVDAVEGWATISYKVGILAPCPVMMVK
ncbi:MAG: universal stress protein [Thermodesulfobacteriota bacterium]